MAVSVANANDSHYSKSMNPTPTPTVTSPQPMPSALPLQPVWRSQELLQGRPEVRIVHGTEVYRLRRTALGKLILTK